MYEGHTLISTVKATCAVGCGILLGICFSKLKRKIALHLVSSDDSMSDDEEEGVFSDFDQGDLKLVLVVQNGLKMGKGKMAAQCAHASVMAYQHCSLKIPHLLKEWLKSGQRKVVVKVESEEALMEIAAKARKAGLIISMVCDAGRTQIPSGSRTVLGVGPGPEQSIDKITGHLKLL